MPAPICQNQHIECSILLTVQISLSTLRNPSSTLILILLQHTNLLQRLHHFPIDASAGIDVMTGPTATILLAAMHFPETAYTDRFAEVDVSRNGCGPDVEPVHRPC